MPVIEREETRARTELGAAQKDTARDLAAKLSSLKGIVWVGVGLFIFGLASLVYPPLKVDRGERDDQRGADAGRRGSHRPAHHGRGNELLILGVVGARSRRMVPGAPPWPVERLSRCEHDERACQ